VVSRKSSTGRYPVSVLPGALPVLVPFVLLLVLTVCKNERNGRLDPPFAEEVVMEPGLAGRRDIIFLEDFETKNWKERWLTYWGGWREDAAAVTVNPFKGNRCLAAVSSRGEHYTTGGSEYILPQPLDEVYYRLYFRLEPSFEMGTCNQYKMFSVRGGASLDECYGRAGIKPEGTRFSVTMGLDNDLELHFYYYHLNQRGGYGDVTYASIGGRVKFQLGRWYSVELLVRANDPDSSNGEIRCWVDGELRGEVTGIRFRTTAETKIRRCTVTNYYGGAGPENTAPRVQRVYMDNIVLARNYVGPYQE